MSRVAIPVECLGNGSPPSTDRRGLRVDLAFAALGVWQLLSEVAGRAPRTMAEVAK